MGFQNVELWGCLAKSEFITIYLFLEQTLWAGESSRVYPERFLSIWMYLFSKKFGSRLKKFFREIRKIHEILPINRGLKLVIKFKNHMWRPKIWILILWVALSLQNFLSSFKFCLADLTIVKIYYKNIFRLSYGSFCWAKSFSQNSLFVGSREYPIWR